MGMIVCSSLYFTAGVCNKLGFESAKALHVPWPLYFNKQSEVANKLGKWALARQLNKHSELQPVADAVKNMTPEDIENAKKAAVLAHQGAKKAKQFADANPYVVEHG